MLTNFADICITFQASVSLVLKRQTGIMMGFNQNDANIDPFLWQKCFSTCSRIV